MNALTAAMIANGWDGLYAAITMARKSETTPDVQAALEKRVEAGEWLRVGDAAKVLGVGRTKMHMLVSEGKIGYRFEPGSKYRQCNPADIKRLLDDSRKEVRGEPGAPADGP
jgi:excisionase family DNA binding protein